MDDDNRYYLVKRGNVEKIIRADHIADATEQAIKHMQFFNWDPVEVRVARLACIDAVRFGHGEITTVIHDKRRTHIL